MTPRRIAVVSLPIVVALACSLAEPDSPPVEPIEAEAGTNPNDNDASATDANVPGADGSGVCPTELQRCSLDFELTDVDAEAVELRGDFAAGGWTQGVPMRKTGSSFRGTAQAKAGSRVQYKYCLDPRPDGSCSSWRTDAKNPTVPPDSNNEIASATCASYTCAPAPTSVRFIAVGDTGKGNAGQYEVARAMGKKCQQSGCDFVLLLGDNIYDSGASSPSDPAFQDKFEKPYASLNVPFYAILGNHDYGGGGAGNDFARGAHEIEYSNRSRKWTMPAAYYRFKKLDSEFFGLDTNSQLYARDQQQRIDIKSWLAESTAKWKIAFGHHPYRSNGPHGNAGTYDGNPNVSVFNGVTVKSFADEVICGKADLLLSGHDHSLQWLTETCSGTELIVSGTGASPSTLRELNPSRFESTKLGFFYVQIEGKKLTAEAVTADGSTIFSRTLTK